MSVSSAVRLLAWWACLCSPGAVSGLASDREQPIEVEADSAELDDSQRTIVYKGNVVATQGSIRLTGDVLTVDYTPEHEAKDVSLQGKPARFRQRLDNQNTDAEGEAVRIEYHAQDNLVHLIENARVTQRGQIYTGHRMAYDVNRNVITMKKASPHEATPSGHEPSAASARVKVILPPKGRQ